MDINLHHAPWHQEAPSKESQELFEIFGNNFWADVCTHFFAEQVAKKNMGKRLDVGMQRTLNKLLADRFRQFGWDAHAGRFAKADTWVRLIFGNSNTLGADFLEALKESKKNHVQTAILLGADRPTLDLISPTDASSMVSLNKIKREVLELDGIFDIPLFYGELFPISHACHEIEQAIKLRTF